MAEPPTDHARASYDDATVVNAPSSAHVPLIGRTVAQFEIVELIGGGGGGDVYRAKQRGLDRSVVVKVMRGRAHTSPKHTERFLREAKLASRLDHPYAAHVYAFGAESDDLLWIAMEHVRGTTLSDLVDKRGSMPLSVFAAFFERLCEVVRSAHELGIIHRDIKPSNVMVIERAGQLLPKLLDFGIAKGLLDDDVGAGGDQGVPGLTEQGSIVGTPTYMAPEQWNRPELVDHRSDVYALGGLAYRCVTGRPPFLAATRDGLAKAHLRDTPVPLGVGPPTLDEAIQRALAKDREQRWQSATDFAAAVRKALGGVVAESIPVLDTHIREFWTAVGPQPLAEALATLVEASTTVEADHAMTDIVDVACRWLAALALAGVRENDAADADARSQLRDHVRTLAEHTTHPPPAAWLAVARAAGTMSPKLTALSEVFERLAPLEQLAERVGQQRRSRNPNQLLGDITLLGNALDVLLPLLDFKLVIGGERGPELWMGHRTPLRERFVAWGDEIGTAEVVLIDVAGRVVLRLDPFVRVRRPLPHGDVELFLIAAVGRGFVRLAATPWGFELDDDEAARFFDRLLGRAPSALPADDEASPYPGLSPFGRGDAARFFGREHEADALANRLVRAPMVAVLGPSGVGKSSFLLAGLAPRLVDHHVIAIRPGRDPIAALATAIDHELARDADAIVGAIHTLAGRAPRGVVLIVDQMEELVTLASAEARASFDRVLARLAGAGVRVVAGIRDDFASMLESTEGMRDRFEPFVLGSPSAAALQRAMIEPARRAGYVFEADVVEDIVAEIAGRPATLPLLAFTAARLWEHRDRETKRLTATAYDMIGGVGGAIARYADEVYASLGRRDRELARSVFSRLVAPDGTRVPVSRGDLDGLGDGTRVVIDRLVDARLLSMQDTDQGGDDIVEPIHECLAERWPRLVRWRTEDAADRALIADLHVAARRWEASGRDREQLWRGPSIVDLQRLVDRSALLASEREFAAASIAHARRTGRRRRAIVTTAVLGALAVAGVMFYLKVNADDAASHARRMTAVAERQVNESLVAHGRRELFESRPAAALAYFAEVLSRGADSDALRFQIGVASAPWRYQVAHWNRVVDTTTPANPMWFAAATKDGEVRWWNHDGTNPRTVRVGSEIRWAAFSPDATQIAILEAGRVTIVDRETAQVEQSLAVPREVVHARTGPGSNEVTLGTPTAIIVVDRTGRELRRFAIAVNTVRIDASGNTWVVEAKGEISTIDVRTGNRTIRHPAGASQLRNSGDRDTFAFIGADVTVAHVMRFDGTDAREIRAPAQIEDLALSRDGSLVGVVAKQALHVYDTTGVARPAIPLSTIAARRILIEGDDVWVGGTDGILRHWRGGRLIAAFPAHATSIDTLVLLRSSLVTSAANGEVALWSPDASPIEIGPELCPGPYRRRASVTMRGASLVRCDDERGFLVGPRGLAVPIAKPHAVLDASPSPGRRAAIRRQHSVEVVDPNGRVIATREIDATALAFLGEDDVLLATVDALHRWTFSRDELSIVAQRPTPGTITALSVTGAAVFVGDDKGTLVRLDSGRETARITFDQTVDYIVPSPDARWLVLKLYDGTSPILGATDLRRAADLPRGGDTDAPPAFDDTGELVVRIGDGGLAIFERATGQTLVALRELAGFLDSPVTDGVPEQLHVMFGGAPGILRLPRDRRDRATILREIGCRIPFRIDGVTLRETNPRC